MKKIKQPGTGRYFVSIGLLAFVLILSSCSRKMIFGVSSVTPAAQGSVKVNSDKNSNYAIAVKVSNLADPDRLTPSKKAYVVWMVTSNDGTKNIGQLISSGSLFSKRLTGSLKTVSVFKPERFFITAEDDASSQYPGTPIVLNTN